MMDDEIQDESLIEGELTSFEDEDLEEDEKY